MQGALVILAAGVASRMKKSIDSAVGVDRAIREEARHKSKSMIGVGGENKPFLDYLIANAGEAGYRDIVIVVNERDNSVRDYYGSPAVRRELSKLQISFAVQRISAGRSKPLGTADALLQALLARADWKGKRFTVCNSDNLYSVEALDALRRSPHPSALIDYDRAALRFEKDRITQFAVIDKDADGFVREIVEKPSAEEISRLTGADGRVGVSMNIFRFPYDIIFPLLGEVPIHPVRQEKEIPTAVGLMLRKHPRSMMAIPRSEHVPDLTTLADLNDVLAYIKKNQ